MKNKGGVLTPDSANISDMQTNEDDDERAESSESRSRGKRRTAREIANMFEQLKQRHIARKKEWQEEREELMKRVQMADESKRVLAEIKGILEHLREELRLEERKRIEMEADHLEEKQRWEAEKAELLRRLEESTNDSDRDGKGMKQMRDKIAEQSRELTEWQGTVLDLKKQLLEKENKFLREKRELQLGFEKERASWKKREQALADKLRQLDNKSSASSTSPSHLDVEDVKDFINLEDYVGPRRRSIASAATEKSKYSNFHSTVDDALKQIEKISSDLKNMNTQKLGERDRALASPSPQPGYNLTVTDEPSPSPSPTAPWRTKRRPNSSRRTTAERTNSFEDRPTLSRSNVASESPVDVSMSLPVITTAQTNLKRSPNPERRVRKINSLGNQLDIIVSSPEASTPSAPSYDRFFPRADQSISEASSPRGNVAGSPRKTSPSDSMYRNAKEIRNTSQEKSPKLSRQSKVDFAEDTKNEATSPPVRGPSAHKLEERNRARETENTLGVNESEASRGRSTSPTKSRLPRLHQQLLFKKEPSLPLDKVLAQRSFESESLASTDKGRTSEEESRRRKYSRDETSTRTQNESMIYDPYLEPKVYVRGSRSPHRELGRISERENYSAAKPEAYLAEVSNIIPPFPVDKKKDEAPPAVHPKPRVSIHKDQEGNIVRVSPAVGRKSVSPDSNQGSEKQSSIAGRMGKAGREWIRKKLSFKDRRPEEQEAGEKGQSTPEQPKKRGKTKLRQRPTSWLRTKGEARSLTSSEESTDAEQEERRRESFLRRSRRKGKSATSSGGSNTASPARKPKKYTRSKTEATPKDMRNFLTKFKVSQSNPNKPSVVKQFELKLLENEVKTLTEENVGRAHPRRNQLKNETSAPTITQQSFQEEGVEYLSGEEGDAELDPLSPVHGIRQTFLPSIRDSNVAFREPTRTTSQAKPKAYYRRSMTDFKPNSTASRRSAPDSRLKETDYGETVESKSNTVLEAGELCEKKSVSKLVNRFSGNFDEVGVSGTKKPIQNRPAGKSRSAKITESEYVDTNVQEIPRTHSLSSQDGQSRRKRLSASVRFDTDSIKETAGDHVSTEDDKKIDNQPSWRKRRTQTDKRIDSLAPSRGYGATGSQRVSAPPGKFDSLESFWESERPPPDNNQNQKPGRMKIMSEEMKRKADMLEQALVKGPRRPRRYRRADTQPVHSSLLSSEEDSLSDTDGVLDVALRPFMKDSTRMNEPKIDFDDDLQEPGKMHETIPPVAGKFSKPAKPGRLPSRWAR